MVFKFAYFVELRICYVPEKFQCCRLSGSSFKEGFEKGCEKHLDNISKHKKFYCP